jgi:hypothetical protein
MEGDNDEEHNQQMDNTRHISRYDGADIVADRYIFRAGRLL